MKLRALVTVAAVVMVFNVLGRAQRGQVATVPIGFPFAVGTTDLPAGTYTVTTISPSGEIQIKGSGGTAQTIAVVSHLARHDKDPGPELVFDKIGGRNVLSEVWFPGEDGFLLLLTKEPHQHAVVGGSNPHQ
jgi:hypothetical protein